MRTITIELPDPGESGYCKVQEGDKFSEDLCWGEMLEQLISLTAPSLSAPRYAMHTREYYEARERVREADRALRDATNDFNHAAGKPAWTDEDILPAEAEVLP